KVKDPQKAFERYSAAFELAPQEEQTSVDLERAAKVTGAWDRVIESFTRAIEGAAGDRDLQIMLRLKLGRVLVEEVSKIDEALSTYRAVYEEDSENGEALTALERLYRQTERYTELLGIYEKKRELAADPNEKKGINYEIAKLYETDVK